jgi:hypothetical protein
METHDSIYDEIVTGVTPAKVGAQADDNALNMLDSGFRRNDVRREYRIYESIKYRSRIPCKNSDCQNISHWKKHRCDTLSNQDTL